MEIVSDDLLLAWLLGANPGHLEDPRTTSGYAMRLLAHIDSAPDGGQDIVEGRFSRAVADLTRNERDLLAEAIVTATLPIGPLLRRLVDIRRRKLAPNILRSEFLAAGVEHQSPLLTSTRSESPEYRTAAGELGIEFTTVEL